MSIVEVAKLAGVSKSTVSRVINQVPGVAEPLRQAVLDAMQELQYQPSPRRPGPKPASRRGVRTGNVLLLLTGIEAGEVYRLPVMPSILHGVESALTEAGMNLVLAGIRNNNSVPAALHGEQIDGIILLGSLDELTDVVRRKISQVPMVVLLRSAEEIPGNFDHVLYNNRAVGPLAAEYLLSRGHKHTVFYNENSAHIAFGIRQRLFAKVISAAGGSMLEYAIPLSLRDPQEEADLFVEKLKATSPAITAACVASDAALPALYRSLKDQGIRPQEDLDIVSCDNEKLILDTLHPKPATIDIRAELMGRLAIRQLRARLAHPEEQGPLTIMVEPVLIPCPG